LWVCVLCQINTKRKHLFSTNQEMISHQNTYHRQEE
jgi:hypothetical protein